MRAQTKPIAVEIEKRTHLSELYELVHGVYCLTRCGGWEGIGKKRKFKIVPKPLTWETRCVYYALKPRPQGTLQALLLTCTCCV